MTKSLILKGDAPASILVESLEAAEVLEGGGVVLEGGLGGLSLVELGLGVGLTGPVYGESPLAEMYRASILEPDPQTPTEYLVWAFDEDRLLWSKNDRYRQRFDWDGRLQRWAPLRGSAPTRLTANTGTLKPWKASLPIGFLLTGAGPIRCVCGPGVAGGASGDRLVEETPGGSPVGV